MSSSDPVPGSHDADAIPPRPQVVMFSGPNGSGKSTINAMVLADPEFGFDGTYINADDIAKVLKSSMPDASDRDRNIRAANDAETLRLKCLHERRDFAFETVMSTPEKVAILTQAKAAGYDVMVVFVTTSSAEINVGRVEDRVKKGGHAVEPDAVRKRYDSAMQLLACALEHADNALIFDNSADHPVQVAKKLAGGALERIAQQPPAWYVTHAEQPMQARQQSRDTLQQVVNSKATIAQVTATQADASHSKSYKGPIVGLTEHHALQQLPSGVDDFVLHDRSLLAPQDMPTDDAGTTVTYAYDKGKLAQPSQAAQPRHDATPTEKPPTADLVEKAASYDPSISAQGKEQGTKHHMSSLLSGKSAYRQALAPPGQVWTSDQESRAAALAELKSNAAGALLTFAEVGTAAIQRAGDAARVDWTSVEREAAIRSLTDHRQHVDEVLQAISQASPNAVTAEQCEGMRHRINTLANTVVAAPSEPGPNNAPSLES